MNYILGFDLSLRHGAVVELKRGRLNWFAYYSEQAGVAKRHPNGYRLRLPKTEDRQAFEMVRLAEIESWIRQVLLERRPKFVGIEHYALHSAYRSHQIGEVGGAARLLCWQYGVRLRLHDPVSTKMFVTWDGSAQKDLVERTVKKRWGQEFSSCNLPVRSEKKQNRTTSEDLADAFAIAQLVWHEVQLRAGDLTLKDLAHDKERQVFLRTTKTFPVSLLGREWIHNADGRFADLGRLVSRLEGHNPQMAKTVLRLAG